MVRNWRMLFADTLTIGTALIYPTKEALAQNITIDGTLGTPQTLTGPNYDIPQSLGQTVNSNLFHSFGKFNLNSNEAAIFQSGNEISNIFSRVTGGSPSSINGLIRTLGRDVNLFFLNPNGIIFGENASLDVSGSFVASTADSFVFGNGLEFSATNPQAAPLLTVNFTPGLQYGQNNPSGTIANQGNLSAGQNLELWAGNLDLQGQLQAGWDLILQGDAIEIRDSQTNPFIAAAGNQLLIQGNQSIDIFALNHPHSGLFSAGDMILSSANPVIGDIHFWSGGNFQIKNLDDSKGDLFSFYDPIIRSQGDVSFFTYQGASLHILAGGKVDINTAIITNPDTTGESINPTTTPNLANVTLSDGTVLVIDGSERPTLDIRAGVAAEVIGNPLGTLGEFGTFFDPDSVPVAPPDNNPVATSADIAIGDIFMAASDGTVLLTNQYQPNLSVQGGDITLTGEGLFGDGIDGRGFEGNGSDVFLDSRSGISLNNSFIVTSSDSGLAGDITLLAKDNIILNSGSFISSQGLLGGNITLTTNADILIEGSGSGGGINSVSFTLEPEMTGGDIKVGASSFSLSNGSEVGTFTLRNGNAGNVIIRANEKVSLEGFDSDRFSSVIRSQALQGSMGDAGSIEIETGNLRVPNGAQISAGTMGSGKGGALSVNAESVEVIGTGINSEGKEIPSTLSASVFTGASGDAGTVAITTNQLLLIDGGVATVTTFGSGDAGDLVVKAQSVEIVGTGKEEPSGLFTTVTNSAIGTSGSLMIETGSLRVANGGQISSSTAGLGDSGDLTVKATEIELIGTSADDVWGSGLFATVTNSATGKGGSLMIETGSLHISDGAVVSVSTSGLGNAGDLRVEAQSIELTGHRLSNSKAPSALFAQVNPEANGDGGNLIIKTDSLKITEGAQISASTFSEGSAGDLIVTANLVEAIGSGGLPSGLFTQVNPEAKGNGGDLTINTETLKVIDGAVVSASTFGNGDAGNIIVTANSLETINGGQIITNTSGDNSAGNITLEIIDSVTLTGGDSGIFANTEEGSSGNGGSILTSDPASPKGALGSASLTQNQTPQTVLVKDGATIAVNSEGSGEGGSITLAAEELTLDNGSITAETASNQGGNITLTVDNILQFIDDGQITATAGTNQAEGDGGNVTINTNFILAFPTNNTYEITANAFKGDGGNIEITTNSFFGSEFVKISATSSFGLEGDVSIEILEIDPARGLTELPSNVIDASQQISRACTPKDGESGRFVATGRGGLPLSPNEPLRGTAVVTNWVDEPTETGGRVKDRLAKNLVEGESSPQIVEAQGWIINDRGNLELITEPHTNSTIPINVPCNR